MTFKLNNTTECNEVLIWDLDGVILDSSNQVNIQRILSAVQRCNITIHPDRIAKIKDYWHLPARGLFKECFHLNSEDIKRVYKELIEIDRTFSYELVKEARETLLALSGVGFRHGILSNRNKMSLMKLIKKHNIEHLFEYISSGSDRVWHKPDPRAFDDVLNYFRNKGISKRNCRYFGDTPGDIMCGNARRVETIGVLSGIHSRKDLLNAGVKRSNIIPSIAFVPKWLVRNGY